MDNNFIKLGTLFLGFILMITVIVILIILTIAYLKNSDNTTSKTVKDVIFGLQLIIFILFAYILFKSPLTKVGNYTWGSNDSWYDYRINYELVGIWILHLLLSLVYSSSSRKHLKTEDKRRPIVWILNGLQISAIIIIKLFGEHSSRIENGG